MRLTGMRAIRILSVAVLVLTMSWSLTVVAQDEEITEEELIEILEESAAEEPAQPIDEAPAARPTPTTPPTPRPTVTRQPTATPLAACATGDVRMSATGDSWIATGFAPGMPVTLDLVPLSGGDGASLSVSADDRCVASFSRPSWVTPGEYRLVIRGTRGNGRIEGTSFTLTVPEAAQAPARPPSARPSPPSQNCGRMTVTPNPRSIIAGQRFAIQLAGFAPNSIVEVVIFPEGEDSRRVMRELVTVETDCTASFIGIFPGTASTGAYIIHAFGTPYGQAPDPLRRSPFGADGYIVVQGR